MYCKVKQTNAKLNMSSTVSCHVRASSIQDSIFHLLSNTRWQTQAVKSMHGWWETAFILENTHWENYISSGFNDMFTRQQEVNCLRQRFITFGCVWPIAIRPLHTGQCPLLTNCRTSGKPPRWRPLITKRSSACFRLNILTKSQWSLLWVGPADQELM